MREGNKHAYVHGYTPKGKRPPPTYSSWVSMKTRCLNNSEANHAQYARYGGSGIGICERWMKFENFIADMGERPPGTSLDRIDNSRGYEPGNCRWATAATQTRNRSNTKLNEAAAMLIRHMRRRGETVPALAYAFGVSGSQIKRVVSRELWRVDAVKPPARTADAIRTQPHPDGTCQAVASGEVSP